MTGTITERLAMIRERMRVAARLVGRDPDAVTLVAVGKGQSVEVVRAGIAAGVTDCGENYVQELVTKGAALGEAVRSWHFIGHLQRNKVKAVLPYIRWIHSLDSLALAEVIERRATRPVRCLIEVNIGGEASKSGVPPTGVRAMVEQLRGCRNIELRGLMCIPPPADAPEANRPHFRAVAALLRAINASGLTPTPLTELSMGMSDDFEIAIEEGATMIRIGTALFGARAP
ncbi:MAG: YggS family pyridoxal phosphate-dependent enzyme [Deltaproteobacteria bacterium]|nr:YggS family pyridoxal phosphate-dependent enzyme [Deltaproteobacteria bacterium]